jgi:hypothetical protein
MDASPQTRLYVVYFEQAVDFESSMREPSGTKKTHGKSPPFLSPFLPFFLVTT